MQCAKNRRCRRRPDGSWHRLSARRRGCTPSACSSLRRRFARPCRSGCAPSPICLVTMRRLLEEHVGARSTRVRGCGARLRFRSGAGEAAAQTENICRARKRGRAGCDSGQQFVGHSVDGDRAPSQTSRARHRHAFLESAASRPAGGSDRERKNQRRGRARDNGATARCGKTPVHVRRDVPGFVGNRLQHALKREAIALCRRRRCDAETIDTVMKEGTGARMAVLGPMEQIGSCRPRPHARYCRGALRRISIAPRARIVSAAKGRRRQARDENRRGLPPLDCRERRRGAPSACQNFSFNRRKQDGSFEPITGQRSNNSSSIPGGFPRHAKQAKSAS